MRSPTVFALILLGSGAAASAEPKQEETSGRVSLNEKDDQKRDAPRSPSDWVELASATPAKHGTMFFMVGKDAGSFSKIRLDAAKGKTFVKRVKVVFADGGGEKVVQLDRALSTKRNRSLVVDLGEPRPIERVVITTEATSGQYSVHGTAGGGVVSSR
jgi:hypothetical protein